MENVTVADCSNDSVDSKICRNGTENCPSQIDTYFDNYVEIKYLVENTLLNKVFLHENKCSSLESAEFKETVNNVAENSAAETPLVISDENVYIFGDTQDEVASKKFKFVAQNDPKINDAFLKREADDEFTFTIGIKKFKCDELVIKETDNTLQKSNELNNNRYNNIFDSKQYLNETSTYVPTILLDIDEEKANATNLKYLNAENNCTTIRENLDDQRISAKIPKIDKNQTSFSARVEECKISTHEMKKSADAKETTAKGTTYKQDIKPTIVTTRPSKNKNKYEKMSDSEKFDLVKRQWSTETLVDPMANLQIRFTKKGYSNINFYEIFKGSQIKKFPIVDVYTEHLNYLQKTLDSIRRECQNLKDIRFRSHHHLRHKRYIDQRIRYLQEQKCDFSNNITKMKSLIEEVNAFYKFYENKYMSEYEKEQSDFVVTALREFDAFYGYSDP